MGGYSGIIGILWDIYMCIYWIISGIYDSFLIMLAYPRLNFQSLSAGISPSPRWDRRLRCQLLNWETQTVDGGEITTKRMAETL